MKNKYAIFSIKNRSFKGFLRTYLMKKEMKRLFASNDITVIMELGSHITDSKVHNYFQEQLIAMNNVKYIYLYAKYVETANVELLENALIKYNDLEYIYLFAKDVKNSSTRRLEKIVADSLNIDYIIKFANDVSNVNISLFEDMLIGEGCISKLIRYVNSVTKCNRFRIIKKVINSGTSEDIMHLKETYEFSGKRSIEDELMMQNDYLVIQRYIDYSQRKEELENYILKSGKAKAIYTYAKDYQNANINKCQASLILTNDMEYMYKFGCDVQGADTDKLLDAIININIDEVNNAITDKLDILIKCVANFRSIKRDIIEKELFEASNPKYLYMYALKVKDVCVSKIEQKLIEIKNARYLCLFAMNIEGANINILEENIRNYGNIEEVEIIKSFYESMIARKIVTLDKYENAMINLNCARYIYEIIRKYESANFDKLEHAILQINDLEYVFKVAKIKKNGDLTLEEDALINSDDLTYLIMFYNLPNVNKIRVQNKLLNCGNASFVYSFGITTSDISSEIIMQTLVTIGDEAYIRKYRNYLGGIYQKVKKNS